MAETLPSLLETLTQSLKSASQSAEKIPSLIPPEDGISLLDTKNELFLSYLQNLVFLILLKLRNRRSASGSDEDEKEATLDEKVVKKLVELTVYIERGPLNIEGKLKYQIDKVLRAAQDAENAATINVKGKPRSVAKPATKQDDSEEGSDGEDSEEDEDEDGGVVLKADEIDDLQYRPNPSALTRPAVGGMEEESKSKDGLYKPPRITATSMPTTERRAQATKPQRSATISEFIDEEYSEAPTAQASIGSGIVDGGRRRKSDKEKADEAARKKYEEENYTRLAQPSKKERRKGRGEGAGYGGEEWRDLGLGADRIERATRGTAESKLAKSRKRDRAAEDGQKDSGVGPGRLEISERVQKRVKVDGKRRDRGRK